jgi:hypothetical protein
VAGGFVVVVGVLVGGAAVAGLVPTWWTIAATLVAISVAAWSAFNWRRTAVVLILAMGLFLAWAIGTLMLAA